MAVVLLLVALALFLLSTRQFALLWRAGLWLCAAACLAVAACQTVGERTDLGLLAVLIRHPDIVAAAFQRNWPTVGAFAPPTLDILILLAALLGLGCLVALTPGEALERAIRPMHLGLIGAVFGAAAALAIAAIGFGPVAKRQVFIGYVPDDQVIDGDTFRIGDISLRLWGVDAPEDHQICLRADKTPYDCGRDAREALRKLATPGPIFCTAPHTTAGAAERRLEESFGRPLVVCGSDQQGHGQLPDVGCELVRIGYAFPYQQPNGQVITGCPANELADTAARRLGLHAGRFLKPTLWRNNLQARCDLIREAGPVREDDPEERKRLEEQLARLRSECGL